MKRRDFFKLAACAGLSVTVAEGITPGWSAGPPASNTPYDGPLYLMVNANGGWDPTSLCDPKGNNLNRLYGEGEIKTAGPISYAPGLENVRGGKSFFEKYQQELLVINGMDMSTNSHSPGTRYTWTGRLDNSGYPTFSALVAAIKAPDAALSHIAFGYAATGGVVPLSRLGSVGQLESLSQPYNVFNNNSGATYHTDTTRSHIDEARRQREQLLLNSHRLPQHRENMSSMFLTKLSLKDFKRLQEYLPSELPSDRIESQATIVMAAYQAGLCVSANLKFGEFDTHSNHDETQIPELSALLVGVDAMMERADALNIRERIVCVIGSEFSRTPNYNKGNGKDHWSVGTMMCMGLGIQGKRVIGGTDEGHGSLTVDPVTLKPSEAPDALALRPEHVHDALRRLAGIHDHPMADQKFRIETESLPVFG